MTQRYSGKHWYGLFSDVGFHYGPSFQGLREIETTPTQYEAVASLHETMPQSGVDGESDYVLHPAVLDAALQLVLVAIHAGRAKDFNCAFVPVYTEEVTVCEQHQTTMPDTAGRESHAARLTAQTQQRGPRSVCTSAQIISEKESVAVDISGLVCVAYEAAGPQSMEKEEEEDGKSKKLIADDQYLRVEWKPDVSRLSSTQARDLMPENGHAPSELAWVLELLAHKRCDMTVLHLDRGGMAAAILEKFQGHFYREYRVLYHEKEENTSELIQLKDRPNLNLVATSSRLDMSPHAGEKYSLVIVDLKDIIQDTQWDALSSVLEPGGYLLIAKADELVVSSPSVLQSAGLQQCIGLPHSTLFTKSLSKQELGIIDPPKHNASRPIVLVSPLAQAFLSARY